MGRFNLNQILSDTSKAAAGGGSAKPRPSESRYEKLSVFDLVPSEDNFYSMREIGELKAAIEIAGKVLQIPQSVSDTIANMRRENERLTVIKGEILSELNALNYREKAVIYGFYIDGLQWERLSQRVNYSPRQCRNIRNIALDRLAKRFEQNKQISRYVFPEK